MRKTILFALALLPFGQLQADTITTRTYAKSSEGCKGSGICTVTTTSSSNLQGYIVATWTYDGEQRRLIMVIPDDQDPALPGDLEDMLSSGSFVMEAEYRFPDDIASELGGSGLRIPKGEYEVNRTSDGYQIAFDLD